MCVYLHVIVLFTCCKVESNSKTKLKILLFGSAFTNQVQVLNCYTEYQK